MGDIDHMNQNMKDKRRLPGVTAVISLTTFSTVCFCRFIYDFETRVSTVTFFTRHYVYYDVL